MGIYIRVTALSISKWCDFVHFFICLYTNACIHLWLFHACYRRMGVHPCLLYLHFVIKTFSYDDRHNVIYSYSLFKVNSDIEFKYEWAWIDRVTCCCLNLTLMTLKLTKYWHVSFHHRSCAHCDINSFGIKGILWDRQWSPPSIGISSHTCWYVYRNAFLIMKLSNLQVSEQSEL